MTFGWQKQIIVRLPRPRRPIAEPDAEWWHEPIDQRTAAAHLKISVDNLSRLSAAGDIPVSYALGSRSPRYTRDALRQWLAGNGRAA